MTKLVVAGLCCVSVGLVACTEDEGSSPLDEMPAQVRDGQGLTWTRVGRVTQWATEKDVTPEPTTRNPARPRLEDRTIDELAHHFRARALFNGYEYLSEPNYRLANMMKNPAPKVTEAPPAMPNAGPIPEDLVGQDVIGSDARSRQRANTSYPFSPQVVMHDGSNGVKCSGTMIGPSTMLTAAHCVHTGSSWMSARTWAPAVDSQDPIPTPWMPWSTTFPTTGQWAWQCYSVMVPGGWDSDKDVESDYAVIEFSDAGSPIGPICNLFPGNQVGWLGLWFAGDGQLENGRFLYGYGYPGVNCPGGCAWPQIWGAGNNYIDAHTWFIDHNVDSTGGQSGMGLYVIEGGGRYVVAIHKGYRGILTNDNWGRRVTDTLLQWMTFYSAYTQPSPYFSFPSQ